jgi:hypothetical protein
MEPHRSIAPTPSNLVTDQGDRGWKMIGTWLIGRETGHNFRQRLEIL